MFASLTWASLKPIFVFDHSFVISYDASHKTKYIVHFNLEDWPHAHVGVVGECTQIRFCISRHYCWRNDVNSPTDMHAFGSYVVQQ